MAAPRKRPSPGFSEETKEEVTEKEDLEDLIDEVVTELFEEVEKREEEVKEEVKEAPLREIIPTDDLGPRFVEAPVVETKAPPPEFKRPRPHPRNTPRFTRVVK